MAHLPHKPKPNFMEWLGLVQQNVDATQATLPKYMKDAPTCAHGVAHTRRSPMAVKRVGRYQWYVVRSYFEVCCLAADFTPTTTPETEAQPERLFGSRCLGGSHRQQDDHPRYSFGDVVRPRSWFPPALSGKQSSGSFLAAGSLLFLYSIFYAKIILCKIGYILRTYRIILEKK